MRSLDTHKSVLDPLITSSAATTFTFSGTYLMLNNSVGFMTKEGTPTNGTSGDGAAVIGVGGMCIDRTNGVVHVNAGTKASPVYARVLSCPASDNIFIITTASTPSSGTSGDGAGTCGVGSMAIDTATGKVYSNQGTKASPAWTELT
jgi:hypothetical protein